jgi:amino acid transporter
LVHYIPTVLVIVLPPSKDIYSFILNVEGYPAQLVSLALGIGLIWLRYDRPDLKRPFKAWIPGVVLRILLSLLLLAAPYIPSKKNVGLAHAWYAIVGTGM